MLPRYIHSKHCNVPGSTGAPGIVMWKVLLISGLLGIIQHNNNNKINVDPRMAMRLRYLNCSSALVDVALTIYRPNLVL